MTKKAKTARITEKPSPRDCKLSEQERSMAIIEKISQKYLKPQDECVPDSPGQNTRSKKPSEKVSPVDCPNVQLTEKKESKLNRSQLSPVRKEKMKKTIEQSPKATAKKQSPKAKVTKQSPKEKTKKGRKSDPYDADSERTPSTSSESSPSSLYDFMEEDDPSKIGLAKSGQKKGRKPLSTTAVGKNKVVPGKKAAFAGKGELLKGIDKKKKKKTVDKGGTEPDGAKISSVIKTVKQESVEGFQTPHNPRKPPKRKPEATSSNPDIKAPKSAKKSSRLSKDNKVSFMEVSSESGSELNDSGVFISPPPLPGAPILKIKAKDTSTPANMHNKPHSVKQNKQVLDSSFGFGDLNSISTVLSPVLRVTTPVSDYGSMPPTPEPTKNKVKKTEPPVVSDLFDEEMTVNKSAKKEYKGLKRTHKKKEVKRFSMSKAEEWAEKMNSQFSELENFELSVEG